MLDVSGTWSRPVIKTFHQFVVAADGRGGFAVVETGNLASLALGNVKFLPCREFAVYPVLDIQQGTGLLAEAAGFHKPVT